MIQTCDAAVDAVAVRTRMLESDNHLVDSHAVWPARSRKEEPPSAPNPEPSKTIDEEMPIIKFCSVEGGSAFGTSIDAASVIVPARVAPAVTTTGAESPVDDEDADMTLIDESDDQRVDLAADPPTLKREVNGAPPKFVPRTVDELIDPWTGILMPSPNVMFAPDG